MTDELATAEAMLRRGWWYQISPAQFALVMAEYDRRAGWLDKIAEMHVKYVDQHGGTWGECNECGYRWPCPTYAWATGQRDPVLNCWDPMDDEEDDDAHLGDG